MTDHPESEFDLDRRRITGRLGTHPIVDLNGVPEEHWVEVLSRFHPSTYGMTVARFEAAGDSARVRRLLAASGEATLLYGRDELHVPNEGVGRVASGP
jgi:hypothetical protein